MQRQFTAGVIDTGEQLIKTKLQIWARGNKINVLFFLKLNSTETVRIFKSALKICLTFSQIKKNHFRLGNNEFGFFYSCLFYIDLTLFHNMQRFLSYPCCALYCRMGNCKERIYFNFFINLFIYS
jgi:hypothetical protein